MKNIFLVIVLIGGLFAGELDEAKKLYENNKYTEALKIFTEHSDDPESLYYLGKSYLYGSGVEKDFSKAFIYAQKSSSAGYAFGINLLGLLYMNGQGVEKDEIEALSLYQKAAKKGNYLAMFNLGRLYEEGNIVNKDLVKAKSWYEKVIQSGSMWGYSYIADMYFQALNDKEALKYYKLFQEKSGNDSIGLNENIGFLYLELKDYVNAYPYLLKAAKMGSFMHTFNLLSIVNKEPILKANTKEALYWARRAADKKYNKTDTLYLSQMEIYDHYYYQVKQTQQAVEFAEKAYENDNNIMLGCALSEYYSMYIIPDDAENTKINLTKAFNLASEILDKNSGKTEVNICYSTLSGLYLFGVFRPKDIHKAIALEKEAYKFYPFLRELLARKIGSYYLKQLEDYSNAKEWYKKAYELNKDEKYLHIVDQYKNSHPEYVDYNISDPSQQVFPVLDNFNSPQQITSIIETTQYYFIATDQKSIYMYDKSNFELVKELRTWVGGGAKGIISTMAYDEGHQILYVTTLYSDVDFSKNDTILAIDVVNNSVLKTIKNKSAGKVTSLSISDDGKYLLAINLMERFNIINIETKETQTYSRFMPDSKLLTGIITKKGDDYIANVLDSNKILWQYSVKLERQISSEPFSNQVTFNAFDKSTLQAQQAVKKISVNHNNQFVKVAFNEDKLYLQEHNKALIRKFDINRLELLSGNEKINFDQKVETKIEVKYKNNYTTLEVYNMETKKLLTTLEFLWQKAVRHLIINNKYILVVTKDLSQLLVFDLKGKAIASLSGVQSMQNNILHYKDGYLFSSGVDKGIHIWNLSSLDSIDPNTKDNFDSDIVKGLSHIAKGSPLEMLTEDLDQKLLEQQAKMHNMSYIPTEKQFKSFMRTLFLKKEIIEPLSSLYIKNDNWIVYNKQGLFASSDKGKKLIRYHLNQGLYKEARIIKNDQIFEKFYRPDLMRKILAKEKLNTDIDVRAIILNIRPPEVQIVQHLLKEKKNLELTYRICDMGNGISNVRLVVNGTEKSLKSSRGLLLKKKKKEACQTLQDIITLEPGNNIVALKAYDKNVTISNISESITVKAEYSISGQPDVYFASLAVSDYKEPSLKLKYAVADVLAIENMMTSKSKNIFKKIHTYQLHDNKVTKENFNSLFNEIAGKIKMNDVLMLYIAGHGLTNEKDGLFYFLPYDTKNTSAAKLQSMGISVSEIKRQLSKVNTNKFLIMIDTCSSGSFIENTIQSEGTLGRLSHGSNRNYIVASSKTQVALEGYKDHGVFTYGILEAFENAYFADDNILTVGTMSAYVERVVPRITQKKFQYEQVPQKYLSGKDFDIAERQ